MNKVVKNAREALEKAIALDPGDARAFYHLGLTQSLGGDTVAAIAASRRGVASTDGCTSNALASGS